MLKAKGWKTIYQTNGNWKEAGTSFTCIRHRRPQLKLVRRHKECHYTAVTGTIHRGDTTLVNLCAPSIGALNLIRQDHWTEENRQVQKQW
jgi:hypothetical protein